MKRCLYKYPFEYPFAPIYGGSASLCSQCETWLELFQFKQCLKSFTGKLHAHFMGLEPRISPFSLLLQQEELILKLESLQQWLNFFELSSYISYQLHSSQISLAFIHHYFSFMGDLTKFSFLSFAPPCTPPLTASPVNLCKFLEAFSYFITTKEPLLTYIIRESNQFKEIKFLQSSSTCHNLPKVLQSYQTSQYSR